MPEAVLPEKPIENTMLYFVTPFICVSCTSNNYNFLGVSILFPSSAGKVRKVAIGTCTCKSNVDFSF